MRNIVLSFVLIFSLFAVPAFASFPAQQTCQCEYDGAATHFVRAWVDSDSAFGPNDPIGGCQCVADEIPAPSGSMSCWTTGPAFGSPSVCDVMFLLVDDHAECDVSCGPILGGETLTNHVETNEATSLNASFNQLGNGHGKGHAYGKNK